MVKPSELALSPGLTDETRGTFLFRFHMQHSFIQKLEEEVDCGSIRLSASPALRKPRQKDHDFRPALYYKSTVIQF